MNKTAKDIMTKNVMAVREDISVGTLLDMFEKFSITAAPVVDIGQKLIGIVTKSDILGHFMDIEIHANLLKNLRDLIELDDEHKESAAANPNAQISTIMTRDPITAEEDTPLEYIAKIMLEKHIHKIIITKGDSIVGIVSPIDFLYHIAGAGKNE